MLGSSLHQACKYGRHGLVQQLLAAGANVEAEDNGKTPLFYAAERCILGDLLGSSGCYDKIVQMLLAAGANVHARGKSPTGTSRSVLHAAAEHGRLDMVQQLLAAGADVNVTDARNCTPLYYAVHEGHSDVVQVLLAAGADVNVKESSGFMALHLAAEFGMLDIAQQLLAAGADVEAVAGTTTGATPLVAAAFTGHTEVVRLLLAAGARVEPERNAGITPIYAAAELAGHFVPYLLQPLRRLQVYQQRVEAAPTLCPMPPTAAAAALRPHDRPLQSVKGCCCHHTPPADQHHCTTAAVLKEWASDVSKRDEQRAAVHERQAAVAKQQQVLQQLVLYVAGIAADLVEDCLPDVAQLSC